MFLIFVQKMQKSVSTCALALLAITSFTMVFSQQQSSCPLSGADEKFLVERRMQGLRASILAQLGMRELNTPKSNVTVSKEQMDAFLALTQATNSMEQERDRKCQSEEIYAQPITTIVGTLADDSLKTRDRRSLRGKRQKVERNVLDKFDVKFDFQLKQGANAITRADVLLFQHAALDNDYVVDGTQYVEIKAVFEPIGLKTVVASKNIDIFNNGFQAFDITPAVKLWSDQQINGSVNFEITVSCLSSRKCAEIDIYGRFPTTLKFDFVSPARQPRLVVISKNPLEVENQDRNRRQAATTGEGVFLCKANQSTCCLKKLVIDFEKDLGLGFVIMPKTFEANYCEGICPVTPGGKLMTPEVYKFITRLTNHPAASIEPCCAGNRYRPLIIVMPHPDQVNNPGGTIIEQLQQVTVESCRCA